MRALKLTVVILILSMVFLYAVEDLPLFHQWVPDSLVPRPPIHHWTLDNGLEVLFWENHTVPVVNVRALIKTGASSEGKYLGCGISHYLEHIVSGGSTAKHTENEYKLMIQENGLSTNAYTTSEVTCYYGTAPVRSFRPLLLYLAENVQECAFDSFEIAREKGVITQEISKGNEEPGRVIWQTYSEAFYRWSPYQYPTIGYKENFLCLTRQDLVDYYTARYVPNNTILAIAGDLTPDYVKAMVDSMWSGWPRQPLQDTPWLIEPLPVAARVVEKEMDVKMTNLKMGFPTSFYGENDQAALRILGMILSGVATSRLDLRLVNNPQPLANSISAYSSEKYNERGQFMINCSFDYQNRDMVIAALWDEIEKVQESGVTQDEVDWAKRIISKQVLKEAETVEGQTSTMMYNFMRSGKAFTADFYFSMINRVSPLDVKQVAQKYLVPEHMVIAILKPIGAEHPNDTLLFSRKASGRPSFEVRELENGMKMVLAENPALPTIDLYIYMMGGALFDPEDKPGLAYYTSSYLREGTKKYPSFESLVGRMDDLGISIDGSCGQHTMYLSSNFVSSDLDDALDLISEMLLYPVFPKNVEKKLVDQQLNQIRSQYDSWSSEAYLFFNDKFYDGHPYGQSLYGIEEAVSGFTADQAKEYWWSRFEPVNTVIAASGPISVDEMADRIERIFCKAKSKGIELPAIPPQKRHDAPGEYKKEVNREQVTLIMGFDGCDSYNEEDKWALRGASALLNGTGGLSGWLSVELRGKRDLVYITWASSSSNLYGGRFTITSQFEPTQLDTVKVIILKQFDRLKSGDFEEAELKRVMEASAEQYVMARQEQGDLVSSAGLDELYGFGFAYSDKYPEKMRSVTKDDVIRVAQKYFNNPVTIIMYPAETAEK